MEAAKADRAEAPSARRQCGAKLPEDAKHADRRNTQIFLSFPAARLVRINKTSPPAPLLVKERVAESRGRCKGNERGLYFACLISYKCYKYKRTCSFLATPIPGVGAGPERHSACRIG